MEKRKCTCSTNRVIFTKRCRGELHLKLDVNIRVPTEWPNAWSTKFKTHYVAPQFFIFRRTVKIAPTFLHWNAHIFFFWLNPTWHSKFHNTSKHPPPATDSGRTACTPLYPPVQMVTPLLPPPPPPSLSRTEDLCPWQACATTDCSECAR